MSSPTQMPSFFQPVDFQALNQDCDDGGQTFFPGPPPYEGPIDSTPLSNIEDAGRQLYQNIFGGQWVGRQGTIDPDCDDRGRDPLTVNGNSVNTGRYTIVASTADGGSLKVTDNETGESFLCWGDPHIKTDKGDTTSFQRKPVTFDLPDGTKITIDPTHNSGVNYINNVTITKGNDAVQMSGFQGDLDTKALPGDGYYLDATTPEGTVLTAENGNIDQLELPNGTLISGDNVKNIDKYANEGGSSGQSNGQIYELEQQVLALEQEVVQLEQQILQMEFNNTNMASPLGFMSED